MRCLSDEACWHDRELNSVSKGRVTRLVQDADVSRIDCHDISVSLMQIVPK